MSNNFASEATRILEANNDNTNTTTYHPLNEDFGSLDGNFSFPCGMASVENWPPTGINYTNSLPQRFDLAPQEEFNLYSNSGSLQSHPTTKPPESNLGRLQYLEDWKEIQPTSLRDNGDDYTVSYPDYDQLFFDTELPVDQEADNNQGTEDEPKTSTRFSRPAVRVLKSWLLSHWNHPYPNNEDKEELMSQTGLNKAQITTWLTNARRRGKHKSTSSRTLMSDPSNTMMERRGLDDELQSHSAMSYFSPNHGMASSTSKGISMVDNTDRQNRGQTTLQALDSSAAFATPRMYQCTFCIKTFKTKYDWQRHETSIHLSLEEWICAPNGPVWIYEGILLCAFCGQHSVSLTHIEEQHNYSACAERPLEKRSYHRKDHLLQHLKVMHNLKLQGANISAWKAAISDVKSRCGFCGLKMHNWGMRTEHLAEHFKSGKSMSDWKGGWGFEPKILEMVENAVEPDATINSPNYSLGVPLGDVQSSRSSNTPFPSTIEAGQWYPEPGPPSLTHWNSYSNGNTVTPIYSPGNVSTTASAQQQQLCLRTDVNQFALAQQLTRFIVQCTSANNPNRHVPTDAEIRHHARWIVHGDDAPWKLTPADDIVWLSMLRSNFT